MLMKWQRSGAGRLIKVSFYKDRNDTKTIRFFDYDEKRLVRFLRKCHVELIHVEHLLNAELYMLSIHQELHVPLIVTLHDYYFVCPYIQLTDENDVYCGEQGDKSCNECLTRRGFYFVTLGKQIKDIKEWRKYWLSFLKEASLIIVPSKDMEQRIKNYFPFFSIHMRES